MRKLFRGKGPIWLSMEVPKKQKQNGEEEGGVPRVIEEEREGSDGF